MMTSNFVLFPFLPSKFKGHNNIHYDSTLWYSKHRTIQHYNRSRIAKSWEPLAQTLHINKALVCHSTYIYICICVCIIVCIIYTHTIILKLCKHYSLAVSVSERDWLSHQPSYSFWIFISYWPETMLTFFSLSFSSLLLYSSSSYFICIYLSSDHMNRDKKYVKDYNCGLKREKEEKV